MDHLNEGVDNLKKDIDASFAAPADDAPDERDNEVWAFLFEFTDSRGKVWSGNFVNTILSLDAQSRVGVMRARLQGGQPIEALDAGVLDLNLALAHMAYSFDAKGRPEWASDAKLGQLKDAAVLFALFAKVRSHEDRYFRREANSSQG